MSLCFDTGFLHPNSNYIFYVINSKKAISHYCPSLSLSTFSKFFSFLSGFLSFSSLSFFFPDFLKFPCWNGPNICQHFTNIKHYFCSFLKCVCIHVQMNAKSSIMYPSSRAVHIIFETEYLTGTWDKLIRWGKLASEVQVSPCPFLSCTEITSMDLCTRLKYVSFGKKTLTHMLICYKLNYILKTQFTSVPVNWYNK